MKPILTTQEAAEILGTDAEKVRRWCRENYLPAVKIGREYRISTAALVDWWEAQGGGRLDLNEELLSKPKLFKGFPTAPEKQTEKQKEEEEKSSKSSRRILRR